MKTQSIHLDKIATTFGTQTRAKIDADTVQDYANAMTDGDKFPPVVVFHDGGDYILADGFHRVMAATRNGQNEIIAEVRKGTKSDALKYALAANCTHGLKRTNADKRRSVELALAEWPKLSDREIARICAVSHTFVAAERVQLATVATSERQGADGKTYKVRKSSIKSSPETPANEDHSEPPRIKTADQEFAEAMGTTPQKAAIVVGRSKSKLPSPLFDALDLAKEDLIVVLDPEFDASDCQTLHSVARKVRNAANELERFIKTNCS